MLDSKKYTPPCFIGHPLHIDTHQAYLKSFGFALRDSIKPYFRRKNQKKRFRLLPIKKLYLSLHSQNGPLAQLNRVSDYATEGYSFESCMGTSLTRAYRSLSVSSCSVSCSLLATFPRKLVTSNRRLLLQPSGTRGSTITTIP